MDNLALIPHNFSYTYAVPVETVSNLAVSRTKNNKSLLAQWDKLVSELPVGEIVVYQIEYRNKGKDIIMTARISATFDFFSILELEDASAYEVGVHALALILLHVHVTLLVCINWNRKPAFNLWCTGCMCVHSNIACSSIWLLH